MALSQLLGGWTKWGWPRFSLGVFLIGFLPVLVVGGWVLLARQPADWMNTSNWSRDLGIYGAVADIGNILPAVAFGIGLVFGFSFDTAGPRDRAGAGHQAAPTTRRGCVDRDADEPLTAERGPCAAPHDGASTTSETTTGDDETTGSSRDRGAWTPPGTRDSHAAAAARAVMDATSSWRARTLARRELADASREALRRALSARASASSARGGYAPQPHKEEDRACGDEREDQRRAARDPEQEHAEPEEEEEEDGPGECLHALVDARHAQVHRRRS